MRFVLCGAVVLGLLQCCTAVPLKEFVGYPFSNETHQVYRLPPYYMTFPVNISVPFVIDGIGITRFMVSCLLSIAVTFSLMLSDTPN